MNQPDVMVGFFLSFNTQYYSLWFSILRPCDTRMPNWYAPPNRKHAKKKNHHALFLDMNGSVEPPSTTLNAVGYLLANTITIGTWHRICMRGEDLQLQYNLTERLLSWHIRTDQYHFKMDISFDMISNIDYQISSLTQGAAELSIEIEDVPHFYMDMGAEGWVRCGDFTENAQATQLRQHVVSGEASQLRAQVLQLAALDADLSNKIHMIEEEEEEDQQPFASLVNFDWMNDEDSMNAGVQRYSSMPILGNPGEDLSWP
jgi:hypothetical protein